MTIADFTAYNKRTVAAKITPIPIPIQFKSRVYYYATCDSDENNNNPSSNRHAELKVKYCAVEGDDGVNTKLVIFHSASLSDDKEIVVSLNGNWIGDEKPALETYFERNFFCFCEIRRGSGEEAAWADQ